MDGNFSNKIFFSVEAYFILSGYVNKQNYCIWGSENQQVTAESPLHTENSLFGILFGALFGTHSVGMLINKIVGIG